MQAVFHLILLLGHSLGFVSFTLVCYIYFGSIWHGKRYTDHESTFILRRPRFAGTLVEPGWMWLYVHGESREGVNGTWIVSGTRYIRLYNCYTFFKDSENELATCSGWER